MWRWGETRFQAAALVARRRLKNDAIAAECKVSPRTLDTWKARPEFQAEVTRIQNQWREKAPDIADPQRRMFQLSSRWRRGQSLMEQRAEYWRKFQVENPGQPIPPGALSGVLDSEGFFDAALFKEMRAHELQAAGELGQGRFSDVKQISKQVILVMSQAIAPASSHAAIEAPPEPPPRDLPGVVIDLVPEGPNA